MEDWLITHLNERERVMYRIAMINAKDPKIVDETFYHNFVIQPERLNETARKGCDSLNTANKQRQ